MDGDLLEKLKSWRRHLHAHPELSQQETLTSAFVRDRLDELGIPFVGGIGGNGIVATLHRAGSDRSVGLRADMDALPIAEQGDAAYASKVPGVMHACGHDGHTVSLLGAAAALSKDPSWKGTVRLIFQPAEENGAGAKAMIADGLFDRFPSTAGDDFAFLIADRPGAYVWIGNGLAAEDGELHNAHYDFNDEILAACVAWMTSVARLALQPEKEQSPCTT